MPLPGASQQNKCSTSHAYTCSPLPAGVLLAASIFTDAKDGNELSLLASLGSCQALDSGLHNFSRLWDSSSFYISKMSKGCPQTSRVGIWDNFPFTLWVPLLSEMNSLCLLGISSCQDCSLSLSLCQMPALQIIISWIDSRLRNSSCSTSDMDMLVIGFRLLASHGSIGRHHITDLHGKGKCFFSPSFWGKDGEKRVELLHLKSTW